MDLVPLPEYVPLGAVSLWVLLAPWGGSAWGQALLAVILVRCRNQVVATALATDPIR